MCTHTHTCACVLIYTQPPTHPHTRAHMYTHMHTYPPVYTMLYCSTETGVLVVTKIHVVLVVRNAADDACGTTAPFQIILKFLNDNRLIVRRVQKEASLLHVFHSPATPSAWSCSQGLPPPLSCGVSHMRHQLCLWCPNV